MPPRAHPTPIPTLAPVLSDEDELEEVLLSVAVGGGGVEVVEVVEFVGALRSGLASVLFGFTS